MRNPLLYYIVNKLNSNSHGYGYHVKLKMLIIVENALLCLVTTTVYMEKFAPFYFRPFCLFCRPIAILSHNHPHSELRPLARWPQPVQFPLERIRASALRPADHVQRSAWRHIARSGIQRYEETRLNSHGHLQHAALRGLIPMFCIGIRKIYRKCKAVQSKDQYLARWPKFRHILLKSFSMFRRRFWSFLWSWR